MKKDITNRLINTYKKAFMLTEREKQMLAMAREGKTNKEIGEALGVTPTTARVTVTRAREKERLQ